MLIGSGVDTQHKMYPIPKRSGTSQQAAAPPRTQQECHLMLDNSGSSYQIGVAPDISQNWRSILSHISISDRQGVCTHIKSERHQKPSKSVNLYPARAATQAK